MVGLEVIRVESVAQLAQAQTIRRAVFVREQGVSEAQEFDGRDAQAEHLLALLDGRPIGTLRIRFLEDGRAAKIERVAVLGPARGRRVGNALMVAALARVAAHGAREARLHAQTVAQAFYARLGFNAFGPEFDEDGLRHIAMRRPLDDLTRTAGG